MSTVLRRNRKGTDEQIVRLNSIGMSLSAIAAIIGCHPTSITLRLQSLKIEPADTRRAFMDGILSSMPEGYSDSLADFLMTHQSAGVPVTIKDYIRELMLQDLARVNGSPIVQPSLPMDAANTASERQTNA